MASNNGFRRLNILYFGEAAEAQTRDNQLAQAGYLVDRAMTPVRAMNLAASRSYACLLISGTVQRELRRQLAQAVRRKNPRALIILLCSDPVAPEECENAVFAASGKGNGLADAILPAAIEEQQLSSMLLQLLISKAERRKVRSEAS